MRYRWLVSLCVLFTVPCGLGAQTEESHGSELSLVANPDTCVIPSGLKQGTDACSYINDKCDPVNFRYAKLYYCATDEATTLRAFWRFAISCGFLVLMTLIFFTLGIVASHFLVPNLKHLSRIFHFNERIAGATLLSLGNGTPDLFSTYAALKSESAALAIGELIGSATFVCTVVIGTMAVVRPFKVNGAEFTRDIVFFFFLIVVSFYFLHDGKLKVYECVSMIGLYVFYVVVVILRRDPEEQHLQLNDETTPFMLAIPPYLRPGSREVSPMTPNSAVSTMSNLSQEALFENNVHALQSGSSKLSLYDSLRLAMREGDERGRSRENLSEPVPATIEEVPEITVSPPAAGNKPLRIITDLPEPTDDYFDVELRDPSMVGAIIPEVYDVDFKEKPLESSLSVFSIPFLVPLRLTIPVALEEEPLDSETRVLKNLFTVQVFFAPLMIAYAYDLNFSHALYAALALSVSHLAFFKAISGGASRFLSSLIGFAVCLVWITLLSTELIRILKNMGVVYRIDEGMLGLTVLALGNSVGDLISNTALASLGTPQTGLSACFGTPLLYIMLGIGLNGLIVIIRRQDGSNKLKFELKPNLFVSCAGLLMVLMFYIVVIPRSEWVITRKIGVLAILWWCLLTLVNVVLEFR